MAHRHVCIHERTVQMRCCPVTEFLVEKDKWQVYEHEHDYTVLGINSTSLRCQCKVVHVQLCTLAACLDNAGTCDKQAAS